jgi:hypothetical protein
MRPDETAESMGSFRGTIEFATAAVVVPSSTYGTPAIIGGPGQPPISTCVSQAPTTAPRSGVPFGEDAARM